MVYISKFVNTGGGTASAGIKLSTGVLLSGDNTVVHNLALSNYIIQIRNENNIAMVNQVYPDPTDPSNQLIINMGIALPDGLDLFLVGWQA